jgi:hypothetical protein
VAIDGLHQVTGAGADVAELLANTDAVAGQIALEIMAEGIRMSSSVLIVSTGRGISPVLGAQNSPLWRGW